MDVFALGLISSLLEVLVLFHSGGLSLHSELRGLLGFLDFWIFDIFDIFTFLIILASGLVPRQEMGLFEERARIMFYSDAGCAAVRYAPDGGFVYGRLGWFAASLSEPYPSPCHVYRYLSRPQGYCHEP